MTNAAIIAAIRNEIERLKGICTAQIKENPGQTFPFVMVMTGYDNILSFLSTFEPEKPIGQNENFEKEIADYWTTMGWSKVMTLAKFKVIARYFYGLGLGVNDKSEKPMQDDMTNAELIAKIKAEIERQIKDPQEYCYGVSSINKLRELLDFLSTLESEKPMNPDDAMKELDEKIALVKQRGTWAGVDVDKYMDEVRGREPEKSMELEEEIKRFVAEYGYERREDILLIAIVARHFTEWQKEQMMKEAIHCVVQDDLDSHGASYNIPFIRIGTTALKPKGIGVGDKVRIIIVKED